MEKRNLRKLALMGLTSGLLLSTQGQANAATDFSNHSQTILAAAHKCGKSGCGARSAQQGCGAKATAARDEATTERVQRYPSGAPITAQRLRDQLNIDTKKIYDTLSEAGKERALQIVNKEPTRDKNDIVKSVRDELSKNDTVSLKGK